MPMVLRFQTWVILFLLSLGRAWAQEPPLISMAGLLPRMMPLTTTTRALAPGESLVHVWSGERHFREKRPTASGSEYLLARVDGPAALVRMAFLNPRGRLRIRFDGAKTPLIDVPIKELVQGRPTWLQPPLARETGGCGIVDFPIPFAKRIEIWADRADLDYHFSIRRWSEGSPSRSFSLAEADREIPQVEHIARQHLDSGRLQFPLMKELEKKTSIIAPGESFDFFIDKAKHPRPQSVSWLSFEFPELGGAVPAELLRSLSLEARFDGVLCVQLPLGHFQARPEGLATWQTFTLGMDEKGLLCSRWIMPYETSATISLRNLSASKLKITTGVGFGPRRIAGELRHFHAGFSRVSPAKRASGHFPLGTLRPGSTLAGFSLVFESSGTSFDGKGELRVIGKGGRTLFSFGSLGLCFGFAKRPDSVYWRPSHGLLHAGTADGKGSWAWYRGLQIDKLPIWEPATVELITPGPIASFDELATVLYWYEKGGPSFTRGADLKPPKKR